MQRTWNTLLVLTLILGTAFFAGCGSSGGSSDVAGPAATPTNFTMNVTAAGGTTFPSTVLAPALRQDVQGGILGAISVASNGLVLRITPFQDGAISGSPTDIPTGALTVNATAALITASTVVSDTATQYRIELITAASTNAIFKGVVHQATINTGDTVNATITATSTALALTFEEWLKKGPVTRTYSAFTTNLQNSIAAQNTIVTLTSQIEGYLSGKVLPNGVIQGHDLANTPTLTNSATQAADSIATATPTTIRTGSGALFTSNQFDFNSGITTPQSNSPIGISLFLVDANTMSLGNAFWQATSTRVIRFLPGVTSVNDVTVAPTVFDQHAVASKMALGATPSALAVGDVYGFRVNNHYGALQLTSVSTGEIAFTYKFNTVASTTNL